LAARLVPAGHTVISGRTDGKQVPDEDKKKQNNEEYKFTFSPKNKKKKQWKSRMSLTTRFLITRPNIDGPPDFLSRIFFYFYFACTKKPTSFFYFFFHDYLFVFFIMSFHTSGNRKGQNVSCSTWNLSHCDVPAADYK
jgi:hypothetical protein